MGLAGGLATNGGLPVVGLELGYAQITSTSTPIVGITPTAVTGLSTTVAVGNRPLVIVAYATSLQNEVAVSYTGKAAIYEDGVQVAEDDFFFSTATQFASAPFNMRVRRAPSAGSHTYAVNLWSSSASGSLSLVAGAANPAHIQVLQA